jgi:hypothetical protein
MTEGIWLCSLSPLTDPVVLRWLQRTQMETFRSGASYVLES